MTNKDRLLTENGIVDKALCEIVRLSKENNGIVSNKDIYLNMTGMQRFSEHWWGGIKNSLLELSQKIEYTVDGKDYFVSTWQPMSRSKYNFYRDETRNYCVGGFLVQLKSGVMPKE